jgi:hypothetical protein
MTKSRLGAPDPFGWSQARGEGLEVRRLRLEEMKGPNLVVEFGVANRRPGPFQESVDDFGPEARGQHPGAGEMSRIEEAPRDGRAIRLRRLDGGGEPEGGSGHLAHAQHRALTAAAFRSIRPVPIFI